MRAVPLTSAGFLFCIPGVFGTETIFFFFKPTLLSSNHKGEILGIITVNLVLYDELADQVIVQLQSLVIQKIIKCTSWNVSIIVISRNMFW